MIISGDMFEEKERKPSDTLGIASLPVAVPSPGETVEVEDPMFSAGGEEGHSFS